MCARPSSYLNWTDGASSKVAAPPASACLQGWTAGQAPPYQWANWQVWLIDQWIQYLDQKAAAGGSNNASFGNARLINGGSWAWNASTNTLSWSAAFQVSYPGQADTSNQAAAGGATVADGQVAYVQLNVPFTLVGNVTSGSATISGISSTTGVTVGMVVSGTGIPANATVASLTNTSITLSTAATATNNSVNVTLQSTGAIIVNVAAESSLTPGPQTCVIARNVVGVCVVGIGSGEMLLRDGESKSLRAQGYGNVLQLTAGQSLTAGMFVYQSPGGSSDGGRTSGAVYPADYNTYGRRNVLGVVPSAVAQGATATVVTGGIVGGFSGLATGQQLILGSNGSVSGAGTGTDSTALNINDTSATILVGIAISSTQILLRLPSPNLSLTSTPQYNLVSVNDNNAMSSGQVVNSYRVLGGYPPYSLKGSPWRQNPFKWTGVKSSLGSFTNTPSIASSVSATPFSSSLTYALGSSTAGTGFWYYFMLTLPPSGRLLSVSFTIQTTGANDSKTQMWLYGVDDVTGSYDSTLGATGLNQSNGTASESISTTAGTAKSFSIQPFSQTTYYGCVLTPTMNFYLATLLNGAIAGPTSMQIGGVVAYCMIDHALTVLKGA